VTTAAASILTVIVNFRTPDLTQKCLEALARERTTEPAIHAIVVDGGSADDSARQLATFISDPVYADWVEFLPLQLNGGFGWANNQGVLHYAAKMGALPDYIHFLNPDSEVQPGAVASLKAALDVNPGMAAVGSSLIEHDGRSAASAFRFPSFAHEFVAGAHSDAARRLLGTKALVVESHGFGEVDWVTGASVMIRRDALDEVGLFDDGFFLYYEEVELMHRMRRAGWTIGHEPKSIVMHIGGAATGVQHSSAARRPAYWYKSRQRYFARTRGGMGTFVANLAWLAGYCAIWLPRCLLSPALRHRAPAQEAHDILATGVIPSWQAREPAIARLQDKGGKPPAWMRW
jgi:N-acetylglucosaminyl-diphospho-decaprenol L-rhamnosyltransferase